MVKHVCLAVIIMGLLSGCAGTHSQIGAKNGPVGTGKMEVRNNAASLLADLLNDEKNVDKVLIVKKPDKDVADLVKLIAATAAAHGRDLMDLATNDSTLNMSAMNLPPGETAARDATAKSKEHDLLFSTGVNFEFNLLYSQAEAQNYGWHLAEVAANNSTNPEQTKAFTKIADSMHRLFEQAITQMRALPVQRE